MEQSIDSLGLFLVFYIFQNCFFRRPEYCFSKPGNFIFYNYEFMPQVFFSLNVQVAVHLKIAGVKHFRDVVCVGSLTSALQLI